MQLTLAFFPSLGTVDLILGIDMIKHGAPLLRTLITRLTIYFT